MPRELRNIIVKELREIFRDPRLFLGLVLVPILILPLMGAGIQIATEASEEQLASMEIGFMSLDAQDGNSTLGDLFFAMMVQGKLNVRNATTQDLDQALPWMEERGIGTLVALPENFTETIAAGHTAPLRVYEVVRDFGFTGAAGTQRVQAVAAQFNSVITARRLAGEFPGADPGELLSPVSVDDASIIDGEVRDVSPIAVVQTVATTSISVPIAVSIMILLAAQLAATTVAMEKEQKTLEVLLTLPIRRTNILLGKLGGVVLVSSVATVAMLVSFTYYMSSFPTGAAGAVDLDQAGLAPTAVGYLLLAVSLFLSIMSLMALAVLLAAHTKDVRSAQSLSGVLFLPVFVPAFLLMFASMSVLPVWVQVAIYALPFSYPTLAGQALYTKDYLPVVLGIGYQIAFTAAVLVIAARFFASERVLTARLRWSRARKPPITD